MRILEIHNNNSISSLFNRVDTPLTSCNIIRSIDSNIIKILNTHNQNDYDVIVLSKSLLDHDLIDDTPLCLECEKMNHNITYSKEQLADILNNDNDLNKIYLLDC